MIAFRSHALVPHPSCPSSRRRQPNFRFYSAHVGADGQTGHVYQYEVYETSTSGTPVHAFTSLRDAGRFIHEAEQADLKTHTPLIEKDYQSQISLLRNNRDFRIAPHYTTNAIAMSGLRHKTINEYRIKRPQAFGN